MNRRKGFTRLALALIIPWEAWWALVGVTSYRTVTFADAWFKAHPNTAPDDPLTLTYIETSNAAGGRVNNAIEYGVVYPFLALIVGLIGWWVYRGFKPKRTDP
jgi:hypothetical protein